MLGVEIEFGNNQIHLETSSYKPTKAKTPARRSGFFSFRWWPGAESTRASGCLILIETAVETALLG
jgi:hypothetical protein